METFKTIDECFYLIQNGANIKQGQINGGYPITRIETISNDRFNRDKVGYAGIFELGKYASYVLEDGDLLMSHINSPQYLGRTVLYKKKDSEIIIHGMNLLRLKANVEIINPGFARYLFYSVPFRRQIAKITKKSVNQASFSINDLKKISIVIPSLSVQEKIVKKLNSAISVKNYYERQIELLDELVKARFVEMFGDPRINPMNFNKSELKDTCDIITGNTPSRKNEEYYGDYIEWIKTDNIVVNKLNPTYAKESLSKEGMDVGRTVEKNCILMACIAGSISSIGRVCVTDRKVAFNQQINAIVPKKYNCMFLYVLMQVSKNYLMDGINMALKGILSKSRLEKKQFIVPPLELQNQFASFVEEIDKSRLLSNHSLFLTKSIIF